MWNLFYTFPHQKEVLMEPRPTNSGEKRLLQVFDSLEERDLLLNYALEPLIDDNFDQLIPRLWLWWALKLLVKISDLNVLSPFQAGGEWRHCLCDRWIEMIIHLQISQGKGSYNLETENLCPKKHFPPQVVTTTTRTRITTRPRSFAWRKAHGRRWGRDMHLFSKMKNAENCCSSLMQQMMIAK